MFFCVADSLVTHSVCMVEGLEMMLGLLMFLSISLLLLESGSFKMSGKDQEYITVPCSV